MKKRNPAKPLSENKHLLRWVDKMADLCKPDSLHWVDGTKEEYDALCAAMVAGGTFIKLNKKLWPGCYYARSDPGDVARVEDRTFICSNSREAAGPTNNWVNPFEMRRKLRGIFNGAMRGRTMYVLPFSMGPVGSPDGADRRPAHRFALRRRQHADHGAGSACPSTPRSTRARSASSRACTPWARRLRRARRTCRGPATRRSTSSTSRRPARSGATARATAATRSLERNASRFGSPRTSRATRVGWPSTC